jgi:hypothetical protein
MQTLKVQAAEVRPLIHSHTVAGGRHMSIHSMAVVRAVACVVGTIWPMHIEDSLRNIIAGVQGCCGLYKWFVSPRTGDAD